VRFAASADACDRFMGQYAVGLPGHPPTGTVHDPGSRGLRDGTSVAVSTRWEWGDIVLR